MSDFLGAVEDRGRDRHAAAQVLRHLDELARAGLLDVVGYCSP
jgi:hypothetical protein